MSSTRRPVRILCLAALLVPVGLSAQRPVGPLSPVTERAAQDLSDGLRHHHLQGRRDGSDPWSAHMLEIDLGRYGIDIALAMDQIVGQETPSSMVRRHGAAAGVNGGFSVSNDPWNIVHGDPNGFLVTDGVVLSEPVAGRPALGFCGPPGSQEVRVVAPRLAVRLSPEFGTGRAIGLNRAREAEDVVVYTPEWASTTLTEPGGLEIVVADGVVVSIDSRGSVPIPEEGFVLSAQGSSAAAFADLRPGDPLAFAAEVFDADGSPVEVTGCDFTSAGPVIAREGSVVQRHSPESYREGFVVDRHPRTAVGLSPDGTTLYLFVIDGRQSSHSAGATLDELAELLIAEGADMVYNLDGGGSSAMALPGLGVLNSPSDGTERRRCDVLLVHPVDAGRVPGASPRSEPPAR